MKVITYRSSTHHHTRQICRVLGIDLLVIRSLKQLDATPYFDGIILQGGADINPRFYGEKPAFPKKCSRDDTRDAVEWSMVRRGLNRNVPILGICRGMQMLAVAQGGSLWQDLKLEKVSNLNHRAKHCLDQVKPPLKAYLPHFKVNSRHHQGVRNVPYGMKVLAKAPDRLPEAIWRPGILGVQWHPEDLFMKDHKWMGIYQWFKRGLQ